LSQFLLSDLCTVPFLISFWTSKTDPAFSISILSVALPVPFNAFPCPLSLPPPRDFAVMRPVTIFGHFFFPGFNFARIFQADFSLPLCPFHGDSAHLQKPPPHASLPGLFHPNSPLRRFFSPLSRCPSVFCFFLCRATLRRFAVGVPPSLEIRGLNMPPKHINPWCPFLRPVLFLSGYDFTSAPQEGFFFNFYSICLTRSVLP